MGQGEAKTMLTRQENGGGGVFPRVNATCWGGGGECDDSMP